LGRIAGGENIEAEVLGNRTQEGTDARLVIENQNTMSPRNDRLALIQKVTDGSGEIIDRLRDSTVRVIRWKDNRGKGAAVRAGIEASTGDAVVIYDADLEYDPRDWAAMLRPLIEGQATVVYGSRFTGERRNMMFWHWVGNRFLSLTTNLLYNTTLSDMETCFKLLDGELARSLRLEASRFEIEPEITAKVLRLGHRIWEVPIRYAGREVEEGKKIARALMGEKGASVLRERFLRRMKSRAPAEIRIRGDD